MGTNLGYYGPPLVVETDGLPSRPRGNKRKAIKKRKDWESNLKGYE
jgi:hypothetical protein